MCPGKQPEVVRTVQLNGDALAPGLLSALGGGPDLKLLRSDQRAEQRGSDSLNKPGTKERGGAAQRSL